MIAFSNTELESKPLVRAGQNLSCQRCDRRHRITEAPGGGGLLFYRCGKNSYLAAVNDRLIDDQLEPDTELGS